MITTPQTKKQRTATDPLVDDMSKRVHLTMQRLGYTELNDVHCESNNGHIRLHGTLRSFYLKQIAQSIALKTPGVRRVTNEIEVIE